MSKKWRFKKAGHNVGKVVSSSARRHSPVSQPDGGQHGRGGRDEEKGNM